jgi:hypothetical protein
MIVYSQDTQYQTNTRAHVPQMLSGLQVYRTSNFLITCDCGLVLPYSEPQNGLAPFQMRKKNFTAGTE